MKSSSVQPGALPALVLVPEPCLSSPALGCAGTAVLCVSRGTGRSWRSTVLRNTGSGVQDTARSCCAAAAAGRRDARELPAGAGTRWVQIPSHRTLCVSTFLPAAAGSAHHCLPDGREERSGTPAHLHRALVLSASCF